MWSRANAVFFFSLSVLFALAVGSFLTTLWIRPTYTVSKLELKELKTLRPQRETLHRPEVTDRAIVTFDLDADLRGVFNWNVKQLFVFVTARYATKTNPFNEVVIWDRVVNRTADARLRLTDVFNEHPILDQGTELRGTPITLSLNWDVMPITGFLYKVAVPTTTVRMPPMYCTEAECRPEAGPLPAVLKPSEAAAGGVVAPAHVAADGTEGPAPKKKKKKAKGAAAAPAAAAASEGGGDAGAGGAGEL